MREEKTIWVWGENAKQRLDCIYETAKNADTGANEHLKSLITHLLQAKMRSATQDILGDIIDLLFSLPHVWKPENKYAALLAKGIGDRRAMKAETIAPIKNAEDRIMNSIPSMSSHELRRVIKLLMSNKSLLDIIPIIIYREQKS